MKTVTLAFFKLVLELIWGRTLRFTLIINLFKKVKVIYL